jgi:uncharacterized membrane protein
MKSMRVLVSGLFVAVSPLVLYLAVTRLPVVAAALVIAAWIALRTLPAAMAASSPEQRRAVIQLPAIAIGFSLLGACTQRRALLLLIPSFTQAGLAWAFARTLRSKTPLVEQFARMKKANLEPAEVTYCRTVTLVWAVYLGACALVGIALATYAPPKIWAAYTGVGTYLLVAALFAVEFVIRTIRFRSADGNVFDRTLFRFYPRQKPPAR